MLHSMPHSTFSKSVPDPLGTGGSAWGQEITPSIAHAVVASRRLTLRYSCVHSGTVPGSKGASALLPHMVGASMLRFHTEQEVFLDVTSEALGPIDVTIGCLVGDDCILKLWGRLESGEERLPEDARVTMPVFFSALFWELSKLPRLVGPDGTRAV